MTIRASAAREVERLVTDLQHGSALERDAAVARLRVIGARAIGRLGELLASDAPASARVAALRTMEGLDDAHAATLALAALEDHDPAVALAAVGVLRGWLLQESGTRVVEALSRCALDITRADAVRLAALDALSALPRSVVQPLTQHMPPGLQAGPAAQVLERDPLRMREWLAAHPEASLATLHECVTGMREAERDAAVGTAQECRVTRGAAHLALARRGSRIALYDLREAFEKADAALPLDFVTAAALIGDEHTLESLARAWSTAAGERWWRERLRDAARDILTRTRLNGRHAAVKRVRARWPGFV
jgi:hypothetical protein